MKRVVIVAGHAVLRRFDDPRDERNWFLLPFQTGEVPYLIGHVEAGVRAAATDPEALLVFSGGQTRLEASQRSEAESYAYVAEALGWFGCDGVAGRVALDAFAGFAACGGFSYGDVLGAGRGWATSILERAALHDMFAAYFARESTFALGICNGCQMLSQLRDIIPGSSHWPSFQRNASEQFEARLVALEVQSSSSIFLRGMEGARIPVASAHGEGRAVFSDAADQAKVAVALRYVDGERIAQTGDYPANPNGSPEGIAGVCSRDGRAMVLMPHPERTLRSGNFSWSPADWPDDSPWLRMFRNARVWLG